jgi:glucokinase
MGSSQQCVLLGDIGATNARFALLAGGVVGPVRCFPVQDFSRFTDVVGRFIREECGSRPIREAALAVAGPIRDNRCVLTNSGWTVDPSELANAFQIPQTRLSNDFEATALSLPHLAESDLFRIGGGKAVRGAPMVVLGPGSGLGIACLVPGGAAEIVIASEGGHATLPATSRREDAILAHARERFGHVSAERLISGPGLENLYAAVVALEGGGPAIRSAAAITTEALAGRCPAATSALELFCAMLGTFAGNAALTFGARGGVYVAGGIAPRILPFLAASELRHRFEDKGRLRSYLEAIPTSVIIHPAATFVGLSSLLHSATGLASAASPDAPAAYR